MTFLGNKVRTGVFLILYSITKIDLINQILDRLIIAYLDLFQEMSIIGNVK